MSNILRLVRIGFDNLENRSGDALTTSTVKIFMDDPSGKTAHGKASDWLDSYPPQRMYLGWNGQVYPQFKIVNEVAE